MMGLDFGWGYIEPYITSYLRLYDESVTTSFVHILYTIMLLSQIIGAQLFRPISVNFGYREGISICMIIFSTGLFLCSITTSIYVMFVAMVLLGIALALVSLIGPFLMIGLMPDNLGLAGGLGTAGPTIGPVFWSNMAASIVNPANQSPDVLVKEGQQYVSYFSENIANNTPVLFYITCTLVFVSALVLPIFLMNPDGMKSTLYLYIETFLCDKNGEKKATLDKQIEDNKSVMGDNAKSMKASMIEKSVKIEQSTRRSIYKMGLEFYAEKSMSDISAANFGKNPTRNNLNFHSVYNKNALQIPARSADNRKLNNINTRSIGGGGQNSKMLPMSNLVNSETNRMMSVNVSMLNRSGAGNLFKSSNQKPLTVQTNTSEKLGNNKISYDLSELNSPDFARTFEKKTVQSQMQFEGDNEDPKFYDCETKQPLFEMKVLSKDNSKNNNDNLKQNQSSSEFPNEDYNFPEVPFLNVENDNFQKKQLKVISFMDNNNTNFISDKSNFVGNNVDGIELKDMSYKKSNNGGPDENSLNEITEEVDNYFFNNQDYCAEPNNQENCKYTIKVGNVEDDPRNLQNSGSRNDNYLDAHEIISNDLSKTGGTGKNHPFSVKSGALA